MEPDLLPYRDTCPTARRVVVLAPHPDDEVFGCAGTLLRMKAAGAHVTEIVLTSGDLGGDSAIREEESRQASALLGFASPEFWRAPDRGVVANEWVPRLTALMQAQQSDMLLVPSPWEIHPDHRAACQLGVDAARAIGRAVRLGFYEVGVPLRPNCLCDITSQVDTKRQAMMCFGSQMAQQDYAEQVLGLNRFRSYSLGQGVTHAEAFWFPPPEHMAELDKSDLMSWACTGGSVAHGDAVQVLQVPAVNVVVLCGAGGTSTGEGLALQRLLDGLTLQTYPHVKVVVVGAEQSKPDRWLGQPVAHVGHSDVWPVAPGFLLLAQPGDWLLPDHLARLVDALNRFPHARSARSEVGIHTLQGAYRAAVCDEQAGVGTVGVLWRMDALAVLQDWWRNTSGGMFAPTWFTQQGASVGLNGVTAWTASSEARRPGRIRRWLARLGIVE